MSGGGKFGGKAFFFRGMPSIGWGFMECENASITDELLASYRELGSGCG